MSNQVLQLGTLIIPWLTVVFFLPKKDFKRYIATGLLATLMGIMLIEVGISNGWWAMRETIYPFSLLPLYVYGLFPTVPLWTFKFTYGHFWRYLALEVVVNSVGSFTFWPFLAGRGIIDYNVKLLTIILTSIIAIILYGYQMWKEGNFAQSESTNLSSKLQVTAAKPLPENECNNKDNN